MAHTLKPGQLNATTDRSASTIRWVKTLYDRVEELATELGVSKNSMFNILIREALDARGYYLPRREQEDINLTLDERGRECVEARERARAGV